MAAWLASGSFSDVAASTHVIIANGFNLILTSVLIQPIFVNTSGPSGNCQLFFEDTTGIQLASTFCNGGAAAGIYFPPNPEMPRMWGEPLVLTRGRGVQVRTTFAGVLQFPYNVAVFGMTVT